jgi:CheY-like chemotaxis protein
MARVKDGEQAVRFLFQRGLLTEEPETPDLVVLAAELPIVPENAIIARLRQHPRTQAVPVILMRPHDGLDDDRDENAPGTQRWLHRQPGVIVITGTGQLEREVADAIDRVSSSPDKYRNPGAPTGNRSWLEGP